MFSAQFISHINEVFQTIFAAFQFKDAIDILLVTLFLYLALVLFKRTNSFFIIDGIILLFIAYLGARFFNFYLTGLLLQYFFGFFIVVMVVIFREELRSFFESISIFGRFRRPIPGAKAGSAGIVDIITKSLEYLSLNKVGALIVFPGEQPLDRLLQGGISLNGEISLPLLLSIFDASSPGHDGAVFVEGGRIKKFSAHLPLAEKYQHLGNIGTRHRAGLGLSEQSDAFVLIVSEERGTISLARFGELKVLKNATMAGEELKKFLESKTLFHTPRSWFRSIFTNIPEKILVLLLALFLWFSFVFQLGQITKEYSVPVEFRFLDTSLQVSKVTPPEMTVVLSGKSNEFELLDPKNIRVVIDASSFEEGSERIKINEQMIQAPRSVSIVDYTPSTIRLQVEKKPPENPPTPILLPENKK